MNFDDYLKNTLDEDEALKKEYDKLEEEYNEIILKEHNKKN